MTNTEQLLIRACKSLNPHIRIKSVYRKFYGKHDNNIDDIAYLLTKICEKYNLISPIDLINALNPYNKWKYLDRVDDWNNYSALVMKVMISTIRLCEIKKLDGFIKPARFRREN